MAVLVQFQPHQKPLKATLGCSDGPRGLELIKTFRFLIYRLNI